MYAGRNAHACAHACALLQSNLDLSADAICYVGGLGCHKTGVSTMFFSACFAGHAYAILLHTTCKEFYCTLLSKNGVMYS